MNHSFNPKVAVVRNLPNSFADCLKMNAPRNPIQVSVAQSQHRHYIQTLKSLGLNTIVIPADETLPDCCFIEDTAVVIGNKAAISYLGATARRGEEILIQKELQNLGLETFNIKAPGTLDGGDVLFTGKHLFVGLSSRTNESGARQLAEIFSDFEFVTIPVEGSLHLKSVLSAFDQKTLLFGESASAKKIFQAFEEKFQLSKKYEIIFLPDDSAANVLTLGSHILIQDGFPKSEEILLDLAQRKNKKIVKINMQELIKADGALTCCSLLF